MLKKKVPQCTFFNMIYDRIIPEDHFLKKLLKVADFSFIDKECRHLYCQDNGRRAYLPSQMFKIVFLEFHYNISDREVEEQVHLNMAYKKRSLTKLMLTDIPLTQTQDLDTRQKTRYSMDIKHFR